MSHQKLEANGVPSPLHLGMVDFKAMTGMMCGVRVFGFWPVVQWGLARKNRNRAMHSLHGNGPSTTGNAVSRKATKAELISAGFDVSLPLPDNSLHLFRRRLTSATRRFVLLPPRPRTWSLCSLEGEGSPLASTCGRQGALAAPGDPSPPPLPRPNSLAAVVVMTVPRATLDVCLDWDNFLAKANQALLRGWPKRCRQELPNSRRFPVWSFLQAWSKMCKGSNDLKLRPGRQRTPSSRIIPPLTKW